MRYTVNILKPKPKPYPIKQVVIVGLALSIAWIGIHKQPSSLKASTINHNMSISESHGKVVSVTHSEPMIKKEILYPNPFKNSSVSFGKVVSPAPVKINAYSYAFQKTLKHEGGYGIDNNGYAVNRGINQKWYKPSKGYPKHVKNLTYKQTEAYYKAHYWQPLKLKDTYSREYQAFIFDTAVNKSVYVARKIDRQAMGDLEKAKALRIAHINRWCKCKQNKKYQIGLIKRVRSFTNG